MIIKRKIYSETGDRLKGAVGGLGMGAIGGAVISAPFGLVSWKIPLVTATLLGGIMAINGYKNAYIKLKKEHFEELEEKYNITSIFEKLVSIEELIRPEITDLMKTLDNYNLGDINDYIVPYVFIDDSIGETQYKNFKNTGKLFLFYIKVKSGSEYEYFLYSDGKLKRNNKVITDIKKDFTEFWMNAKENWMTNAFGYKYSNSDIEENTYEGVYIEKMKREINQAFDRVIRKLNR